MVNNQKCIIWGVPATIEQDPRDGCLMNSPRAGGKYFIADTAVSSLQKFQNDFQIKVRLTDWLIDQRQRGVSCPEIYTTIVSQLKQWKDRKVDDRADSILRYLSAKSKILGTRVNFDLNWSVYQVNEDPKKTFYELLAHSGCVGEDDFRFLLKYLEHRRLIKLYHAPWSCILTVEGHDRVSDLEIVRSDSTTAFVAMWFNCSLTDAWERGIEPAIRDVGYKPVRIDRKEHLNKIDDEIIAEISKSRFVVADFTHGADGARGGVYYEAGFAHGLNIPVIFSCKKDVMDKVHFDTRQYNHIVWETAGELRKKLTNRIAAVIGEGPNK